MPFQLRLSAIYYKQQLLTSNLIIDMCTFNFKVKEVLPERKELQVRLEEMVMMGSVVFKVKMEVSDDLDNQDNLAVKGKTV